MSSRDTVQWYKTLYRYGRIVRSPNFQVHLMIGRTDRRKFGIVIPNAVISHATKRNLVKRRILSVLRSCDGFVEGFQCLISVKRDVTKVSMKILANEITQAISIKHL